MLVAQAPQVRVFEQALWGYSCTQPPSCELATYQVNRTKSCQKGGVLVAAANKMRPLELSTWCPFCEYATLTPCSNKRCPKVCRPTNEELGNRIMEEYQSLPVFDNHFVTVVTCSDSPWKMGDSTFSKNLVGPGQGVCRPPARSSRLVTICKAREAREDAHA